MPAPVRRSEKNDELEWSEADAHLDFIDTPMPRVVTMDASGVIPITGPGVYRVETFGGAGSQNLTGISGGSGREWPIVLRLNTPGRIITVIHTPPNLYLDNSNAGILNSTKDSMSFRDVQAGVWVETGGRVSCPE